MIGASQMTEGTIYSSFFSSDAAMGSAEEVRILVGGLVLDPGLSPRARLLLGIITSSVAPFFSSVKLGCWSDSC